MASTPQFSDLTAIPSQTQVWNQELLPALQSPSSGLPVRVTDWFIGGVYRAMGMAVALLRVNTRVAIATLTYAGFEDYVFGRAQIPTPPGGTPIDVTGWAPIVAQQRYRLQQTPATYTLRQFVLTNTSATPYTNLLPGAMIVQFPSGNRYYLQGATSTLAAAIGVSDTVASVLSTAGFVATGGTFQIDSEQISYTGISSGTFTGLVRGANGTTPAAHAVNAKVQQTITIPAQVSGVPGTLTTVFRSEFAYNALSTYNTDPSGSTINLVTTNFPGVTVTNPTTTFSTVAQAGPGIGSVVPSGAPGLPHSVSIQIVTSGIVGSAGWQYALDGGSWSSTQFGASASVGGGITVTLQDNGGNPSFIAGTVFYFTAPGSDITQNGQTAQTAQSLGAQAAGMWPSLAFQRDSNGNAVPLSPTANAYVLLAIAASSNVAMAFAITDGLINNLVHLIIAGQNGFPATPTTVAAVQQFFNALQMLTDNVVVATSTQRPITLDLLGGSGGTIQVKQALIATAQTTLQQRLQSYFGGTDSLAPLGINGLIDYDYVLSLIRTLPGVPAGGVPVGALRINTAIGNLQLPITPGAYEVAQWTQNVVSALPWTAI